MAYHILADEVSTGLDTSWYMNVEDAMAFALQFKFAGTVAGAITVYGSCKRIERDRGGALVSPSTGPWDEYTDKAKTISTEPSWLIDFFAASTGAAWIKVTWTPDGEQSGTISVYGRTRTLP